MPTHERLHKYRDTTLHPYIPTTLNHYKTALQPLYYNPYPTNPGVPLKTYKNYMLHAHVQ